MAGAYVAKKFVDRKIRVVDGKRVLPVLYNGRAVGHGKYFAASIDGQLMLDADGKPLKFRQVGELVYG